MSTKTKAAKDEQILPGVLSVRGAISPSSAVFYSQHAEGILEPIQLTELRGVGTFAAYAHGHVGNNKKADTLHSSNPFHGDAAYMPSDSDTLVAKMSLMIDKAIGNYEAHDNPAFIEVLGNIQHAFFNGIPGTKLASLYIDNLLKCQWLHRNRKAIDRSVVITSSTYIDGKAATDAFRFDSVGNNPVFAGADYDRLVELVRKAFAGETETRLLLNVKAALKLGHGSQLFPSQKWEEADSKSKKTKFLYIASEPEKATGMSPQKVGNGLRTIDVWHGQGDKAIPVNPFGQDRETQAVFRTQKLGNDFYTLLEKTHKNADAIIESINTAKTHTDVSGDVYFVIANLIRGGVFGAKVKSGDKE